VDAVDLDVVVVEIEDVADAVDLAEVVVKMRRRNGEYFPHCLV
jgi:hypothetical protein